MSTIYHIKPDPRDKFREPKDPWWKYLIVIALVIFLLLVRDHRIDLNQIVNFIMSTKGILNR